LADRTGQQQYALRCHADCGAEVPYPLVQTTFVLDSVHENTPPGDERIEDIGAALCGTPHGIFALLGSRLLADAADAGQRERRVPTWGQGGEASRVVEAFRGE
jgi:hypothetical protein